MIPSHPKASPILSQGAALTVPWRASNPAQGAKDTKPHSMGAMGVMVQRDPSIHAMIDR